MALPINILQRGSRASQPAATAVADGTLYCVTDENYVLEQSSGGSWVDYSPTGGSGTVTNTGTLTSGKTIVGNGSADVTVSSLTANLVASSSGTLSGAVASANSKLLGSGASGSGSAYAELSLGTNLSMSGTTLNGGNITTTSAYASPPTPASGDVWFPNDSYYLYRYSGSAEVPWGPSYPFTDPALSGLNTWVNQSTGSLVTTNGGLTLIGKAVNLANDSQAYVKTAPATPYTITAAYLFNSYNSGSGAQHGGLAWRDSGTGKLVSVAIASTNAGVKLSVLKWNSPSSASTTYTEGFVRMGSPIWMQISDDGTNRIVRISTNGNDWVEIHSVGRTDFLTADQVGIFVTDSTNRAPVMTLLSWKVT